MIFFGSVAILDAAGVRVRRPAGNTVVADVTYARDNGLPDRLLDQHNDRTHVEGKDERWNSRSWKFL